MFCSVSLFPIILLFSGSLKPAEDIYDYRIIPQRVTLSSFVEVINTLDIFRSIFNSFFVAIMVTVLALLLHSMAGFSFARLQFPFKKGLFLWVLSTMMVPFSVIMIPLFFIIKQMGLVDSLWGIILPMVPHAYGVFLFRQNFRGIPQSLFEAARIDGCSIFRIFYNVFLPLSVPIFITLGVSFFVTNWNNYLWPTIVTQTSEKYVVQITIATLNGALRTPWNLILAASVIAVIPTMILFIFLQRYYLQGIKMAGIKS